MTSLAQLKKITTPANARLITDMIEGTVEPDAVSLQCRLWAHECYHYPPHNERVMSAADEILGTYGVEGWASMDGSAGVSYCNTGDTYKLTLAYIGGRYSGRYTVTSFEHLATRYGHGE